MLYEAFAQRLPVVATDVGGVRDAADGAALLVPPGDAEAAGAGARDGSPTMRAARRGSSRRAPRGRASTAWRPGTRARRALPREWRDARRYAEAAMAPLPAGVELRDVEVSVLVPVRNEAAGIRERGCDDATRSGSPAASSCCSWTAAPTTARARSSRSSPREDDRIRVLDNPRARDPAGAQHRSAARARALRRPRWTRTRSIRPTTWPRGVRRLERGRRRVRRPACSSPHGVDAGSRRIALALDSPLGVGGAGFRRRADRGDRDRRRLHGDVAPRDARAARRLATRTGS